jgi:hypothetical protein
MQVAANAVVTNPLKVSLLMEAPAQANGGTDYVTKLAVMTALKLTLDQHQQAGGLYTVATPAYVWDNGILLMLHDASNGSTNQAQVTWQWDFVFPLVTLAQAQQAQNAMMSKISAGVPTDGATSGLSSTSGVPGTLATPSVAPSASGVGGAGVAGPTSTFPMSLSSFGP